MPQSFRYVVADVFTDKPLAGNQSPSSRTRATFPRTRFSLSRGSSNLSETVFVYPPEQGGHAKIRIFTPKYELPFAGHPTLGTAFVLGQPLQLGEIRLETGAGVVPVRLEREGPKIVFGRMEQPLPTWQPFEQADALLAALGVERSELPVEVYDNGMMNVYVGLASEDDVAAVAPDPPRSCGSPRSSASTASRAKARRWKTRMFAPGGGVPEDPATGSAAGPLAVHLARHGRIGWGEEIEISQGAEIGRPSKLYARVDGSAEALERVEVGGAAVVVARGEFRL